ncbi:hypothetical protein D9613_012860 [Agrocybe pediades]|uniref:Uncharacterized protein n=1 Tax=Agrocybe pediades TaxID=84607 RepID=A0A8H4QWA3_9AGAR|nr:hypothetical protein D9613_012860 [Agrocybe pediades]
MRPTSHWYGVSIPFAALKCLLSPNTCKKPVVQCSCARPQAYPPAFAFWPPHPPPLPGPPYQTPQRHAHPQYQHFTPSSQPYVPIPRPVFAPYGNPQPFHANLDQRTSIPNVQPDATPSRSSISPQSNFYVHYTLVQETPNGTKRKRSDRTVMEKAPAKRARRKQPAPERVPNDEIDVTTGTVPGVGPSSHPSAPVSHPKPLLNYSPISKKKQKKPSNQVATDVWYFMRPLETREHPADEPIANVQPTTTKPKSPFVGCRLCPFSRWTVWRNMNGIADTIRAHLSSKHGHEWQKIVVLEQLKGWEEISCEDSMRSSKTKESFTLDGFLERLARWIAVDDQSYETLPRRKKLVADLQNSEGRISFTSDLWFDINLRSFMAVTAHYLRQDEHRNLVLKSRLAAFRHVSGSHSGEPLAEYFLLILKELGVVHKIGMITLDNASNCGSMMGDLERLLEKMGVPFQAEGNRFRCFPHVINIAVKAALRELSVSAPALTDAEDVPRIFEQNENDSDYEDALNSDVVAKCRSLVTACRASGQRREELQATIKEGNKSKHYSKEIPEKELLRDMDVRWSSTYLMIDMWSRLR